jgi:hypothetical protein
MSAYDATTSSAMRYAGTGAGLQRPNILRDKTPAGAQ